jgi:hypothetical protein
MLQGAEDAPEAVSREEPKREAAPFVWLLVILGALVGLVSVVAIWLDRVALQTDNYVDIAGSLLEDPAVQDALSTYLVDELYTRVDVSGEIREQLPEEVKSLAPIIAGGGREAAVVAAKRAFEFPRVQSLWREANRNVHEQFLQLIDDEARFVSTSGGNVTLEARPMVIELANRVGLGERVNDRLPPDAGNVLLMQSDELGYAQTGVRVLRFLADWLWILAFLCWGAAMYLARSWRRETVGMIAIAFIIIGIVIVVARGIAGSAVVDELVRVESNRPAAESAWSIVTAGLRQSGITLALIGVIGAFGVWLAGPGRAAVSARTAFAPYIARPQIAFGALAAVFLLFIWWAPIPGARSPLWLLVFGGLAFAGMALLRRQTMREHPNAQPPDVGENLRDWITSARSSLSSATGSSQASQDDAAWLDQLERLQSLRERSAISEEEYQARKTALLQSG